MTRERTKELLPVMIAFNEGKPIQSRCHKDRSCPPGDWHDTENPIWGDDFDYRIKPEPEDIYLSWTGAPSPRYVFYSKADAEEWKSACFGREYKRFREVVE